MYNDPLPEWSYKDPLFLVTLPWPPTINHYYITLRTGRKIIGAKGKQFRKDVIQIVQALYPEHEMLTQRLAVGIKVNPPDRRKRDLDNLCKATLDALTHAEVYHDDCQIDDLRMVRCDIIKPGEITIEIFEKEN